MSRPPNTSLLQKAKSARRFARGHFEPNLEEVELAVAWMNGEIQTTQAAFALGMPSKGPFWMKMASILKAASMHGLVKVERIQK